MDNNDNNPQAQSRWTKPTTLVCAIAKFKRNRQNSGNGEEQEPDEPVDYSERGMKQKKAQTSVVPQPRPHPMVTSGVQGSYNTFNGYNSTASSGYGGNSTTPSYHTQSSRPSMDSSTTDPYNRHSMAQSQYQLGSMSPTQYEPSTAPGPPQHQPVYGSQGYPYMQQMYSPPPAAAQQPPPPPHQPTWSTQQPTIWGAYAQHQYNTNPQSYPENNEGYTGNQGSQNPYGQSGQYGHPNNEK